MKKRVKLAIDKILHLRSEFSDKELYEAVAHLYKDGVGIGSKVGSVGVKNDLSKKHQGTPRSLEQSTSLAVTKLRDKNPDKYEILLVFDGLLRSGKALSKMDRLRSMGVSIDKNFNAGKSRKEAIPRLLNLLSQLSVEEIKLKIDINLEDDRHQETEDEDYRRLATYLISGGKTKNT